MKLDKYRGIIPAFYACYDRAGEVSGDGVRALTRYFVDQGVKGVYVGGSSGGGQEKDAGGCDGRGRGPSHGHSPCCLQ